MATQVALEPATAPAPKRRDFGSSARLWGGFFGRAWLWFVAGCLVVTFVPMLFGWRPYVIESGSMQPRIKVGDVILSSPEHDAKKLLGHVTVFKDPDAYRAGTVKSHRVISINANGSLVTKGDANPTADPTPVPMSDVKGIGRLLVRWIGLPLIWVQNGAWLKLALLVLTFWVAAVLVVRDHDEPIVDEDDDETTDVDGDLDDNDGRRGGDSDNSDGFEDELDDVEHVDNEIPDDGVATPARWKPRRSGFRLLPGSRHRRALTKPEIAKMVGTRTAVVTVTAGALLLPTSQAAFSATTSAVGSIWSTAASFVRDYTADSQALNPYIYWKLDDSAGTNKNKNTTALDYSGNNRNGLYSPTPYNNNNWDMQQPGGLTNQATNLAVDFGGGTGTGVACVTTNAAAENPAPPVYSEIIWFNTTSNQGGKLIGFESSKTGVSNSGNGGQYDRQIYMDDAGHLKFSVYPNDYVTVTSPGTYNDGKWHMAVATMGATNGMKLYVDNVLVGSDPNKTSQDYSQFPGGYWRVGCGNLSGWGNDFPTQTNYGFNGLLDEATVYTTELSAANINQLWTDIHAGPATPPPPPVVPQLVNGDFENGTTGWTGTCASLGAGDPAAHGGSNSLDVTATTGWFGPSQTATCSQSITLPAGQYSLTTYLYGANATVALSGAASASQTVNSNSWQQVLLPFTVAAAGSVTVSVQTQSGNGGLFVGASNSVYADDFSITSP